MLSLLVILAAGFCGYVQTTALMWPLAAIGLLATSLAQNYGMLRHAVARGHTLLAQDTLIRSALNAIAATGAAYGLGIAVRAISGL